MNFDNETKLKDICNEVNSMMSKFPGIAHGLGYGDNFQVKFLIVSKIQEKIIIYYINFQRVVVRL